MGEGGRTLPCGSGRGRRARWCALRLRCPAHGAGEVGSGHRCSSRARRESESRGREQQPGPDSRARPRFRSGRGGVSAGPVSPARAPRFNGGGIITAGEAEEEAAGEVANTNQRGGEAPPPVRSRDGRAHERAGGERGGERRAREGRRRGMESKQGERARASEGGRGWGKGGRGR